MIGLHFLNPVPKIPVVEVVKCLHTSNETIAKVKTLVSNIGKTPVEVYEYPGFVTTRAIVPLLNEAMHILMEEIATAKDIDTAMKLGYNFQQGPLEMADSMGLDEVLAWMETLWQTLGEARYRACPIFVSHPEFAWWDPKEGWSLENRGVNPDIVVPNLPQGVAKGIDAQLDLGVAEVLALRAKKPPVKPAFGPVETKGREGFRGERVP